MAGTSNPSTTSLPLLGHWASSLTANDPRGANHDWPCLLVKFRLSAHGTHSIWYIYGHKMTIKNAQLIPFHLSILNYVWTGRKVKFHVSLKILLIDKGFGKESKKTRGASRLSRVEAMEVITTAHEWAGCYFRTTVVMQCSQSHSYTHNQQFHMRPGLFLWTLRKRNNPEHTVVAHFIYFY